MNHQQMLCLDNTYTFASYGDITGSRKVIVMDILEYCTPDMHGKKQRKKIPEDEFHGEGGGEVHTSMYFFCAASLLP